jgi:uncharacterized RDD family membrane protein YckC
MRYVGVARRFLAVFIDGLILLVMAGPFAEITHRPGYYRIGWHGWHVFWPGLIGLVYYTLLEGTAGATIGKFAVGIRVVNEDGSKLTWTGAIIRNLVRFIDLIPYVPAYLVGAISVWVSPTKQRLGDRWGHTNVVTKESLDALEATPAPMNVTGSWQAAPAPPEPQPGEPSGMPALPPPPPMPPSGT